jgi:hypothetical protein
MKISQKTRRRSLAALAVLPVLLADAQNLAEQVKRLDSYDKRLTPGSMPWASRPWARGHGFNEGARVPEGKIYEYVPCEEESPEESGGCVYLLPTSDRRGETVFLNVEAGCVNVFSVPARHAAGAGTKNPRHDANGGR